MRSHASAAAVLVGKALLVGCALACLGSCVEPLAVSAASVLPRDSIREVRLGHAVDMLGKVPPSFGSSRFAVGDPIHFSMWEVANAPAGSVVRVSVHDATDQVVWSEDKVAPPGGSYVSFGIGRMLDRGKYRADVIVGHEVRTRLDFEVFEWTDQ